MASVAKVIEISSRSDKSFEDAIEAGVARASDTVKRIKGGWVSEMTFDVDDGKVVGYKVNMRLTFVLNDDD